MLPVVDLQSCSLVESAQSFAQPTDTFRLDQDKTSVEPRPAGASVEMADRQALDHMDLAEVKEDNLPDSLAGHRGSHSHCDSCVDFGLIVSCCEDESLVELC